MIPVAIYGGGQAGILLSNSIEKSHKYTLNAFFDDDSARVGTIINSKRVFSGKDIERIIDEKKIKIILIAIPSLGKAKRRELLKNISKYPVSVMELPSVENIIDGNVTVDDIREVKVEDLLGREAVEPKEKLLDIKVKGKSILITGAGGSIGSELCRQILRLNPTSLVLFDNNEFNLYAIYEELIALKVDILIIPVMASIHNSSLFKIILQKYSVNTIYHAAAYKHVPMVESNPCAGAYNNIIGTYRCAISAIESNVETFILISTDKAVRPTNVMGATKRFAELILQALNMKNNSSTCFSMVRFGNVLDSTGSVLPKFREQIRKGGPITVTHRNVIRYFMSIPEAVQLVLQSAGMANGGEVFVLDMGEPVNIYEMAKSMIYLSGLTPCDSEHPDGDITIKITGLRPGEKLYEELLIGDNPEKTAHPLIMKADENKLDFSVITLAVDEIMQACRKEDKKQIIILLKKYIPEFTPEEK